MRIVSTSVIALGIALATTQPARADCCNDFWSCAAAVATGGLSCAVSAAIDELNNLKARAEASRSQAQAEKERLAKLYTDTASQDAAKADADSAAAASATQVAFTKVNASIQKLNVVVSPAAAANIRAATTPAIRNAPGVQANTGAAAAAGNAGQGAQQAQVAGVGRLQQIAPMEKADDAKLKSEAQRAKEQVEKLNQEAAAAKAKMKAEKTDPLRQVGQAGAQVMRTAFEASLIAPIVGLVGTLPPPDPLLTAAMVAAAVATLDRIEADGNAEVARKAKEEDDKLAAKRQETQQAVDKIKQQQTQAEDIEKLLSTAVETRNKADLDKLTAKLGAPPPQPIKIAASALILRPVAASAFKPVGKGFSTAAGAKPTVQMSVKPVTIAPATMAQYKSKSEADVRLRIKAANAADTAKKRNALIDEAKVRFAKDPETLKKVIAYLESVQPQQ